MLLGVAPGTLLIVGAVGGIGMAATYASFHLAEEAGSKLTLNDLRPCLPWEGLPLPRFLYTKPELIAELTRKR